MKYFIALFLLFSIFICLSYPQNANENKSSEHTNIQLSTENTMKHDVTVTMPKNEDDFWKNYFPSILVAIVGIITIFANIIVVNTQIKNQRKISTDQINSALLDIKNQREIAEKQMKYAFISDKRHIWINDLRDTVSKFISCTSSIIMPSIEDKTKEEYFNKLIFLKYKIELLLNPIEKSNHQDIINITQEIFNNIAKINNLVRNRLDTHFEINKMKSNIEILVSNTNVLLKEAWAKVINGE